MVRIEGSITIRRPVEEVFDFVADERNEPSYNPQMTHVDKVTDGPIGKGTIWRATVVSGRRPMPMELEVTDYTRPSRLGTVARMTTADITGSLTFSPEGMDTRMSWTWDLRPKGLLKLASPLFVAIGRRQEKAIWGSLKQRLEVEPNR